MFHHLAAPHHATRNDDLSTITGSNLQDISNHLKASKLSMIRLGGDVTGFSVAKAPGKAGRG